RITSTFRGSCAMALVVGTVVAGGVAFGAPPAAADPPAVACSINGTTLDVQLTGQSISSDPLGVAVSSGNYLIYLGTPSNPQCTVGGPYAVATETSVNVSSTGNVSQ